jgi:hypothetical protein
MGLLFKRRTTLFAVHDASYVSTVKEARAFPEVHDISNALQFMTTTGPLQFMMSTSYDNRCTSTVRDNRDVSTFAVPLQQWWAKF